MSTKALEHHLIPLMSYLKTDGITEICINKPGEVYIEKAGVFVKEEVQELNYGFLESLAGLIAEYNHKEFPAPIIAGSLPGGERVQIVMHPACEQGKIVFAIRRHQMRNLALDDYEKQGSFQDLSVALNDNPNDNRSVDGLLYSFYRTKQYKEFLMMAIKARKNILISGGTGTGKTTFLNACLKQIPYHERLITVEDVREVSIEQPNVVHLLFNENDAVVSSLNIFKTCLRLRPDRIFLSELRGAEVWPYLRAANSGHPGSLSTVHADTPEGAITQMVFMMQQAGTTSNEEQIRQYIKSIIHIVIQLKRDEDAERFMYVSDIYYESPNLIPELESGTGILKKIVKSFN